MRIRPLHISPGNTEANCGLARSTGSTRSVPTSCGGLRHLLTVVGPGLPMPREPAYADERSKGCEAKSASE